MTEELIKNINLIVGAVDGKTLARVKRIVKILHSYEWAVGELTILCQSWNFDSKRHRCDHIKNVRNKLKGMIEKEDEILKKSKEEKR